MKLRKSGCIGLLLIMYLMACVSELKAQQQKKKLKADITMKTNQEENLKNRTLITYCPPNMQKQREISRQKLLETPYKAYYNEQLIVCTDASQGLQNGKIDSLDETLTPSVKNLNHLFDKNMNVPDWGYTVLDRSTMHVRSRIEFPGSTPEMFRWWFWWHPLESVRYNIWFPHAHVSVKVEDPERLANEELPYSKRFYNNRQTVEEYLGPYTLYSVINFIDPSELGVDMKQYVEAAFEAAACGLLEAPGHPGITIGMMIHMVRPTEDGMELYSRYWLGQHSELSRFPGADKAASLLKEAGMDDPETLEKMAYELAVHDMTEWSNLARVLPDLFKEFGSPTPNN